MRYFDIDINIKWVIWLIVGAEVANSVVAKPIKMEPNALNAYRHTHDKKINTTNTNIGNSMSIINVKIDKPIKKTINTSPINTCHNNNVSPEYNKTLLSAYDKKFKMKIKDPRIAEHEVAAGGIRSVVSYVFIQSICNVLFEIKIWSPYAFSQHIKSEVEGIIEEARKIHNNFNKIHYPFLRRASEKINNFHKALIGYISTHSKKEIQAKKEIQKLANNLSTFFETKIKEADRKIQHLIECDVDNLSGNGRETFKKILYIGEYLVSYTTQEVNKFIGDIESLISGLDKLNLIDLDKKVKNIKTTLKELDKEFTFIFDTHKNKHNHKEKSYIHNTKCTKNRKNKTHKRDTEYTEENDYFENEESANVMVSDLSYTLNRPEIEEYNEKFNKLQVQVY